MANSTNSYVVKNIFNQLVLIKEENNLVKGITVDAVTGKILSSAILDNNTMKKFIKDIPKMFNQKVKAVFLYIPELQPPGFSSSYEFRVKLKSKFDDARIPYYFFNKFQWNFSCMLISVDYISKNDEVVLFVEAVDEEITVIAYKFTQDGYIHSRQHGAKMEETSSDKYIYDGILNGTNPKAIFIRGISSTLQRLRNIFGSRKSFTFEDSWNSAEPKVLTEHSKWLFDKTYNRYHVRAGNLEKVCLSVKLGNDEHQLIAFDEYILLPLSSTKLLKKITCFCTVSVEDKDSETSKILHSWLPDQKAHKHEISLSIDSQGFIDFSTKPILWPSIKLFPKLLKSELKSATPVIVFADNLSFIFTRKDCKSNYEFLDSWGGKSGKDLYISFDEEKPKYCKNALDAFRAKPSFVVHNIFEIIALSEENLPSTLKGQFRITKDENNPILLEFDTFDGTQKLASPVFLMAMLIRQHLKAIRNESGEKPSKIIFSTLLADNEEINRINIQLTEVCKMLKLNCEFFDLKKFLKV